MDQDTLAEDSLHLAGRSRRCRSAAGPKITPFDFRKPGQTPGSHMRAIYALKQKFLHRMVSSLSAYLRSSVTAQLLTVDHLSYGEFLRGLPSPTCVVSVGMRPYEGNAVLELNPSLIFPIIEILLGRQRQARYRGQPRNHGNRAERPRWSLPHHSASAVRGLERRGSGHAHARIGRQGSALDPRAARTHGRHELRNQARGGRRAA